MPSITEEQIDVAVPPVALTPEQEAAYQAGQPRRVETNAALKALRTDIAALETGKADAAATTAALDSKVATNALVSPGALPDAGAPTDKLLVIRDVGGVPTLHEQAREQFEVTTVKASQLPGGGVALSAGGNGGNLWLIPSGGDDSDQVEEWVNQQAGAGLPVLIGPGDFIITRPMVWRSGVVLDKWSNKGIGLTVNGCGPGNTRFYYSGPSASPMITVNSPTSAGIGNRNYMTDIGGMSWLRATTDTTQIAAGTTSGAAFYGTPSAQYEVFHTPKFHDLFIDGFDYPVTLSDCTLPDFENVWFCEFLSAVRSGYNQDIVKFRHCMFGSEQFGTNYRNNAKAFEGGFNDGIFTPGNENIVEFEHCWFMKIGVGAWFPNSQDVKGVRFNRSYFEDVRQYFVHDGTANRWSAVSFDQCHFSKPADNDVTQTNPLVAGYQAKIQFGGDPAVTGGKQPILSIRDCTSDVISPANAWVSFNNRTGTIVWENNVMAPSAAFGHVRCIRTSFASWRSFPSNAGTFNGSYVLGDANQAGIGLIDGQPVEVSATIAPGGVYEIDVLAGDVFYLTLPDGDCTITTLNYLGVPPNRCISPLTKVKVVLIAPAALGANRTVSFGSRIVGVSALTVATTDVNRRALMMLEGFSTSGNLLRNTSGTPAFA